MLFFTARGLLGLSAYASSFFFLGTPLLSPARLSGAFILAICAVGIVSTNRRVQVGIATVGLGYEVLIIAYLRFEAGTWVGSQ